MHFDVAMLLTMACVSAFQSALIFRSVLHFATSVGIQIVHMYVDFRIDLRSRHLLNEEAGVAWFGGLESGGETVVPPVDVSHMEPNLVRGAVGQDHIHAGRSVKSDNVLDLGSRGGRNVGVL